MMTSDHSNMQDTAGITSICKWKDGKQAAFSIGGDDSVRSQLDFLIPELFKRGFAGTFWINPGRGTPRERGFCWESRKNDWLAAARGGIDFGNHSVYHVGARYYAEAEYEIGECARIIWEANPGQNLQLFMSGGGTTWNISQAEMDYLLAKYHCVKGRGGGTEDPAWHSSYIPNGADLIGYVDIAIQEGSWHHIVCHGAGPEAEWLPTSGPALIAVLDYLSDRKDQVWVATHLQVHKYEQERSSARTGIVEATDRRVCLDLTSEKDVDLYDLGLTLRTQVPSAWKEVQVSQGNSTSHCFSSSGMIQYEAVPGKGEIILAPAPSM
ncbi:MAG: hypothetical protein ACM3PY_10935 [Omnitrophica WOR_2 bacterium]